MTKEKTKLITITEAAEIAGVSQRVLRRAAKLKLLEAEYHGKMWLTTEKAVKQWKVNHHNPNMRRQTPPKES